MKNLPEKRRVTINGQEIAYTIGGQGQPTVILINGAGGPLEGWFRLYPTITSLCTVVSYDRPGAGASARPTVPQTGAVAVHLLHSLLREIGAVAPYVLVAHSFGGLYANLFARLYPHEVGAVIFLEATAPDDVLLTKQHQTGPQRWINGLLGLFSKPDPNGEVTHEATTVAQLGAAPAFPNIPVKVLSGGKIPPGWMASPQAQRLRARHQQALAALSPQGEHIIAPGSGHFPQMSEPQLVIDVIARVLAATLTA